MAYLQWLITDLIFMFFTVLSMLGNGLMTALFTFRPALRKKPTYYLIFILTVNHFLLGLTIVPHVSVLLAGIEPGKSVNYSAPSLILSSMTLPFFTTTTSVITLGIAFDRMRALISPMTYRFINQGRQAIIIFLLSIAVGAVISYVDLSTAEYTTVRPGCSGACCFCDPIFLAIFAIVEVVINGAITVFCLILMVYLRMHKKKTTAGQSDSRVSEGEKMLNKANLIALYILLGSTLLKSVPMAINLIALETKTDIFKNWGPYLAVTTFMSGTFNVIIYGWKHRDIRAAFLALCGKSNAIVAPKTQSTRKKTISSIHMTQSARRKTISGIP